MPMMILFLKSHISAYKRADGSYVPAHEDRRVARHIGKDEANKILGDAWWGGKNKHLTRKDHDYTGDDDGSGYIDAHVPLEKIRPNEAGDRYDDTAEPGRVKEYAGKRIETPVHLLHGERAARRGIKYAAIMDGGHRVSAARQRGDTHIRAIMQRSHYDRLMSLAD